jgi:hypothetical protein
MVGDRVGLAHSGAATVSFPAAATSGADRLDPVSDAITKL